MPRKLFYEHLQPLIESSNIQGIEKVQRGDDDGEFKFQLTHEELPQSINVTALVVSSLADYPNEHSYFICAEDDVPPEVAKVLQDSNLAGQTLQNALQNLYLDVSVALNSEMEDEFMMDDEDEEMESDADDIFVDSNPLRPHAEFSSSYQAEKAPLLSGDVQLRLCQDISLLKEAGFKLAYTPGIISAQKSYLFISIRISKLGLSEDAMQAWSIKPLQYLVLAVCYINGYKPLEDILADRASMSQAFKIGLCDSYKPDMSQFLHFQIPQLDNALSQENSSAVDSNNLWHPFFLSAPLEELFSKSFLHIISHRQTQSLSWFGAERFHKDYQTATDPHSLNNAKYFEPEVIKRTVPDVVMSDHLFEKGYSGKLSFPLIAMQYLLRHFVRCTEFCLVCHSTVPNAIDALRPYVCDNRLCLYQYMSLGFGPEIEHEIRTNPEIVDLLISMCWLSAKDLKLKSFPDGLDLRVPDTAIFQYLRTIPSIIQGDAPVVDDVPESAKLIVDDKKCELYFSASQTSLRTGEWVVLRKKDAVEHNFIHVKVLDVSLPFVRLSRTMMSAASITAKTENDRLKFDAPVQVYIYRYDSGLEDLNDDQKCTSILHQIDILPSVADMKTWLDKHPGSSLSHWKERLSPVSVGILRWIIASNRSCILPAAESERIGGMTGWTQFRFAMGAPDKEQRFVDALQHRPSNAAQEYPTFFGWHGSRLHNWHSIVREGLRFDYIASGRSYGNGVYHSLDYSVSAGYSGHSWNYNRYDTDGYNNTHWRQSSIKPRSIIALSEMVNAPGKFVSKSPHIVIDQLDWIQVRYLFVASQNLEPDLQVITPEDTAVGPFMQQDPSMIPLGPQRNKLSIPITAIPVSRRITSKPQKPHTPNPEEKEKEKPSFFKRIKLATPHRLFNRSGHDSAVSDDDDAASIITFAEDLEIFHNVENPSNDEFLNSLIVRAKELKTPEVEAGKPEEAKSSTNFVPGSLDYGTLPLLPPPSDSSSITSRQLLSQFKALKKTQDTSSQADLGWYTDPAQMNNVFQWIVELHSFPEHLPITKQMVHRNIPSVVLELRFPPSYPFTPPFVRVIRPRFLPFLQGGGGHVTAGGSLCMELLTSDGWLATYDIASILMQVRMAICSEDPRPAQLAPGSGLYDYNIGEATDGYVRACKAHGWTVPAGFLAEISAMEAKVGSSMM